MAYPNGTEADFREAYDPHWGPLKALTRPVPGNHDYDAPNAEPYYTYFFGPADSSNLRPERRGYYNFTVGNWLFLGLNSNVARGAQSSQVRETRAALQANRLPCVLSYWHHPRWTSSLNGDNSSVQPFWDLLYEFGADVILVGHDHVYERMAPLSSSGNPSADGVRQFTSGGGGASLYGFPNPKPPEISQKRISEFGVLYLELLDFRYRWWFFTNTSGRAEDEGAADCH